VAKVNLKDESESMVVHGMSNEMFLLDALAEFEKGMSEISVLEEEDEEEKEVDMPLPIRPSSVLSRSSQVSNCSRTSLIKPSSHTLSTPRLSSSSKPSTMTATTTTPQSSAAVVSSASSRPVAHLEANSISSNFVTKIRSITPSKKTTKKNKKKDNSKDSLLSNI
jgi:hypothetical protein